MTGKQKTVAIVLAILLVLAIGAALLNRIPNSQQITRALQSTTIENLALNEVTPDEGAQIIMGHFYQQHPEMREVRLMYYPDTAQVYKTLAQLGGTRITLSLRNIPASEAFKYVTSLSNLGFAVRSGRIYLCDPAHPVPITIRDRLAACVDWLRSRLPAR